MDSRCSCQEGEDVVKWGKKQEFGAHLYRLNQFSALGG